MEQLEQLRYCACGFLLIEETEYYICCNCKKRIQKETSPMTPHAPRMTYNYALNNTINLLNPRANEYCPDCGTMLQRNGHCRICVACGFSSCGL